MIFYQDQGRSCFTDGLVVWKELAFDVSGHAGSQLCDLGRTSESLYAQVSSAV